MAKYYQHKPDKWAGTVFQDDSEPLIMVGVFRPKAEDRQILDAKTVGGVHRTNRIINTNQALERIGFFQGERKVSIRAGKR